MGLAMMVFLHGYMGYVSLPNQTILLPSAVSADALTRSF